MNKDIVKPWIEIGYHCFAYDGPKELKIERLSKRLAKNKSSFYHHFAELEIFITHLLAYHIKQTHIIVEKQTQCNTKEEFAAIIVAHKEDLLFNRQLRFYREKEEFSICFQKTNQILESSIIPIWSKIINIQNKNYLFKLVFKLSIDNFFLQISQENLTKKWVNDYFDNLLNLITSFKQHHKLLDGKV